MVGIFLFCWCKGMAISGRGEKNGGISFGVVATGGDRRDKGDRWPHLVSQIRKRYRDFRTKTSQRDTSQRDRPRVRLSTRFNPHPFVTADTEAKIPPEVDSLTGYFCALLRHERGGSADSVADLWRCRNKWVKNMHGYLPSGGNRRTFAVEIKK